MICSHEGDVDKWDRDMLNLTQICNHCWVTYPAVARENWSSRIIAEVRERREDASTDSSQ